MYSTDQSGYCIENRWMKGKSRSWENIKDVTAVTGGGQLGPEKWQWRRGEKVGFW